MTASCIIKKLQQSGRHTMAVQKLPKLPLVNPKTLNWRHLVETLPTAKVEEMRMQSAGYCIMILLRLVWRKRIFTQGTPDKDAATASLREVNCFAAARLVNARGCQQHTSNA